MWQYESLDGCKGPGLLFVDQCKYAVYVTYMLGENKMSVLDGETVEMVHFSCVKTPEAQTQAAAGKITSAAAAADFKLMSPRQRQDRRA